MRKVLFTVFTIYFTVTCDAMLQSYMLQNVPSDTSKVCIVSNVTKQPLSFHDVLRLHNVDRDIPLDTEGYEADFQQYLHTNSDSLKYTSNFWTPVTKTGIEIMFCCFDASMISGFEKKVKPFLEFVKSRGSLFFKIDIVDKYFTRWRDVILEIEKKAKECSGGFYFEEVRKVLNSLLLVADEEKSIIEWSF